MDIAGEELAKPSTEISVSRLESLLEGGKSLLAAHMAPYERPNVRLTIN